MSLIRFNNKTEPKYTSPKKIFSSEKDSFDTKFINDQDKNLDSKSTLLIGSGVTITGNIQANNDVDIQGTVNGDVECYSVIIKKTGNVKGKITTETMTVEGKVSGDLNINDLLRIKSEGSVKGKIFYNNIEINEGGKISGEVNHREKDNKQEEFKELKSIS